MQKFKKHYRLFLILIGLAVLFVYWPSLDSGFIWDDDVHLTQNVNMQDLRGLGQIWTSPAAVYYPLTSTVFWIEARLFGNHPMGYHAFNIALHTANAFLIFLILAQYFEFFIAFSAALVFAVHPVQVESVAWITELKNVLSGFFCFLSVLFYQRHVAGTACRGKRYYFISLGFYAAAVLSKSQVIMLPVVFLLYHTFRTPRESARKIAGLAPFFLISIFAALWTVWEQSLHSGAIGNDWSLSLIQRTLLSVRCLWLYAVKMVFPFLLMFIYPKWNPAGLLSLGFSFVLFLLTAVLLTLLAFKNKINRWILFGLIYFTVMLFPCLCFFDIYFMKYSFVADHFAYHAGIGLITVGIYLLSRIRRPPYLRSFLAAVIVLIFAGIAHAHTGAFRSSKTLWLDTVRKNPEAWLAYHNLATELYREGNIAGAVRHYDLALKIKPDFAEAHINLCYLLAATRNAGPAVMHGRTAIRLQPENASAHLNLGIALFESGDSTGAKEEFQKALALNPKLDDAYANLADVLIAENNQESALDTVRSGLRQNPASIRLRDMLDRLSE